MTRIRKTQPPVTAPVITATLLLSPLLRPVGGIKRDSRSQKILFGENEWIYYQFSIITCYALLVLYKVDFASYAPCIS